MAALTTDLSSVKITAFGEGYYASLPVKAASTIYQGSAVSDSGGNGLAAALTAAENFCGFARHRADNSTGAAGDVWVDLIIGGFIENVSITGGNGNTDHGVAVYMSDDNTFTLTSSSNTLVGKVWSYNAATSKFTVRFSAAAL